MSYLEPIFRNNIDKSHIKIIFELGSRDLIDAYRLQTHYDCVVYAFECNPDCLVVCDNIINSSFYNTNIVLVKKAVSLVDGPVSFFPFDLTKYDNMGASSMLKIDFSNRDKEDPDFCRPNPQIEIVVEGTRIDTFMESNHIEAVDMLCIDLQGYELNALKSMGDKLKNVKYVLTECSIRSTYVGGSSFSELEKYLGEYGFIYKCSNRFGYDYPNTELRGFSEFDALFYNTQKIEAEKT